MTAAEQIEQHPAAALGVISTAALAKILGRENARAGRDWCKRHRIPYVRDGKYNLVRVEDVKRALHKLGVLPANDAGAEPRAAAALAALAELGRRKR